MSKPLEYLLADPSIEEIKSLKYRRALKIIQTALKEWGYDTTGGDKNDPSFIYFVDGVIEATDDWSDEE